MKQIKYIIALIAGILSMAACSLDETSYMEVEKDDFIKNAKEAEIVLLGVYRNFNNDGLYAEELSYFFDTPTDITKVEGSNPDNFRSTLSNSYTATDSRVQACWRDLYNAVYDANDFIERLAAGYETFSDSDKALAAIYMGEVRTLRALFYFELVRWFGNIVLMTDTEQSKASPSTFVQADPVDVYKFIEKDLKYAIDVLPYASDDTYRADSRFRMSKGSALGLLTKVYATWAGYPVRDESKWEYAAMTAKILIDSQKHNLQPEYRTLWYNTNNSIWDPSESLIEVSFYDPTFASGSVPRGRIGKFNGMPVSQESGSRVSQNGGYIKLLPSFLAKWKDLKYDKRFDLSVCDRIIPKVVPNTGKPGIPNNGTIYNLNNAGHTIKEVLLEVEKEVDGKPVDWVKQHAVYNNALTPNKWNIEEFAESDNIIADNNYSNSNWYILRYSDVLLLYAEALNEINHGPDAAAEEALNMVRKRAFDSSVEDADWETFKVAAGLSYEEFQKAVRDERGYEFCGEARRQDLVRWGIYYESIMRADVDLGKWDGDATKHYMCRNYTVRKKNDLLPIPQREMDICKGTFKQNFGW